MNFAILLFLTITTANFADANPISKRHDISMSECLENNEAGDELVEQCSAAFKTKIDKLVEESDFVKGRGPKNAARNCAIIQEFYECLYKIIVDSCGRNQVTPIAKEIFRKIELNDEDKSVPACKQLEHYIESGGAETTDSNRAELQ
ncbi:hypothetical protein Ddc_10221 [Ditylenchus destructor]|nr:hypothetical protein Ddc_10221 [Ditylenchus destructor]